jgi:hypothetical protein
VQGVWSGPDLATDSGEDGLGYITTLEAAVATWQQRMRDLERRLGPSDLAAPAGTASPAGGALSCAGTLILGADS